MTSFTPRCGSSTRGRTFRYSTSIRPLPSCSWSVTARNAGCARSRKEAEAIAERGLRELYKRQQELLVVEAVAEAANTAPTVDETMRFALEKFCEFAGWPVGHLCLANEASPGSPELLPTDIWHVTGR